MLKVHLTTIFLIVFSQSTIAQQERNKDWIQASTPTIHQEATSVWNTIRDIQFFNESGYSVQLPEAPIIDSLISKSLTGTFGNEDYATIYTFLEAEVYNSEDYSRALEKVINGIPMLEQMISTIQSSKSEYDWEFRMFDSYEIVLTLYGPGGSYDPDQGIITMLTDEDGAFKNYDNPANTIIHEIVHIGMEYSIIQEYQLEHNAKEKLVDTFVHLNFKEFLPSYRIQNMGTTSVDDLILEISDFKKLQSLLSSR